MGIMRLLMDHWHLSSLKDLLLSVKRVVLQVGTVVGVVGNHQVLRENVNSQESRFARSLHI